MAEPSPPAPLPVFQTRIFIEKDGTVVFENLAEELLPLVEALAPEGELACRMHDALVAVPCQADPPPESTDPEPQVPDQR